MSAKRRDAQSAVGGDSKGQRPEEHVPVLLEQTMAFLAPERGGVFVDCTVGLGGHAEALLEAGPQVRLIGIDRDPEALELAAERLLPFGDRVQVLRGDFDELPEIVERLELGRLAGVLADLGVSSLQLDRGQRGFSFRRDGPLDMRMGPSLEHTAADVVNGYSEEALQRILSEYGEERRARRLAKALVKRREDTPFETTAELRDAIHQVVGYPRPGRIDPATRAFQAVRIEVNKELKGLERLLENVLDLLEDDGRLVVISYHSLEDRITKSALRKASRGEVDPITGRPLSETRLIELLTKKPVRPDEEEINFNPRSRSARLRAARRL